jgi:GNAT superfamily N-acetyltransferase
MAITYRCDLFGVDWRQLKSLMSADGFDNGRTLQELRRAFANSSHVCIAWQDRRAIATARVLSDGVSNAYLVDLWTWSAVRRRGIATAMIDRLVDRLQGQHLILQSDRELAPFYERCGFREQPLAMSRVVGQSLVSDDCRAQ